MSQPNVRVRRTRTLLRQALVELIEDRGFDRLTVGDLAARAMVSRAAFYRNYRDKYDLVEQVFDEAMAEMTAGDQDDARPPAQRYAVFVQSILWWLEHDRPCPPEELAAQSSRLIRAVITTAADTPGH